jgi:hypothetical protein
MTEGEVSALAPLPPIMPSYLPGSKGDLAMEARRRQRGENGLGLRVSLKSNDGSYGPDIGNRRWSCVNLMHIGTGIAWTHTGAPEILLVTVKGMRPRTMPPIGIPMGVVIIRVRLKRWIWFGLGAQRA